MNKLTIQLENKSSLHVSLIEGQIISILLHLKKTARFHKELNDITTQFIKNNFDEEMKLKLFEDKESLGSYILDRD